jgi:hypothetical protein
MKNMNLIVLRFAVLSCCVLLTAGCSKYERTEVTSSIYVDHTTLRMFAGETVQLRASPDESSFEWTCEDAGVATVSSSGWVTAVSPGTTDIVVTDGNVHARVSLTVITRVTMTGMLLSTNYAELTPGAKVTAVAVRIPENANDGGAFLWTSDNIDVATVSSVGDITGVSEGETIITCRSGNFSETVRVSVAFTRPFKGPHILSSEAPYTLPAVDFDFGGEGYAFHDTNTGNSGNYSYRADNGDNASGAVDMSTPENPEIGWTATGEWLQYTVEVRTGGQYEVEVEQSSASANGRFRIEVDGVDRTDTVEVPNAGGWANFRWDTVPVLLDLSEGVHKIKYYFVVGAHNLRTFRFTYVP